MTGDDFYRMIFSKCVFWFECIMVVCVVVVVVIDVVIDVFGYLRVC